MVTAETAMALPVLLVVTAAMAWLVGLGISQMQVTDAAREGARALARGDSEAEAAALARRAAPGAEVDVDRVDGLVVVTVTGRVEPPGLLDAFGHATVRADATAREEGS